MSRILALLGCVLGPVSLLAAPNPGKPGETRFVEVSDADTQFAQSLVRAATEVSQRYVRPVALKDLLYAGLAGVHEAARSGVPDNLKSDLERATEKFKLPAPGEAQALDRDIVALVARIRANLGDAAPLRGTGALRISLQAMVRSLDPYCLLVSGEELRRTNGENTNFGVGLELVPEGESTVPFVKTVVPGSPAQKAGICPGDRITHLNGKVIGGIEVDRAVLESAIRVLAKTESDTRERYIEITFSRPGKPARQVKLVADHFKPDMVVGVRRNADDSWDYMLDHERKIGYVRVGALEHGVADDVEAAVTSLKAAGLRGLVLDLRWSPGGFLTEAVLVARLFLKEGPIAKVQSRLADDCTPYSAQTDGPFIDFPLAVLVNGETSGGSELIVAALQDNKRALVVGQRTFGKASVQTLLAVGIPDTGLKLTSGSFVRPSGKALHRFPESKLSDDWGVRPDEKYAVPLTPDLSRQLRDWHTLQTLRPASSNEVLPLDDPETDVQQHAALRAVLGTLRAKQRQVRMQKD